MFPKKVEGQLHDNSLLYMFYIYVNLIKMLAAKKVKGGVCGQGLCVLSKYWSFNISIKQIVIVNRFIYNVEKDGTFLRYIDSCVLESPFSLREAS